MSDFTEVLPDMQFPTKDPSEFLAFGLDWTPMMQQYDDALAYLRAVSSTVHYAPQGVTPTPLSLTAQMQSGNITSCAVSGGTLNVTYRLSFLVTTTGGYTYMRSGMLPVNYR